MSASISRAESSSTRTGRDAVDGFRPRLTTRSSMNEGAFSQVPKSGPGAPAYIVDNNILTFHIGE